MALPRLNETPMYNIVIPSTKLKTRYRPYLVKEEKLLLIALETDDEKQITEAIIDLIKACVEEEVDEKKLTTFDMEYLFTQIRSKSVGETAKILLLCQSNECDTTNEVLIPLGDVGVDLGDSINNIIPLTDKFSLEMRWLTYYDILNTKIDENSPSKNVYNNIISSLVAVVTEDERILFEDEGYEATVDFVNNLTTSQFNKLKDFVDNAPQVKMNIEYKCKGCGHDNKITLRGMRDFFQ